MSTKNKLHHTLAARILHWINGLCIVVLTLTGFYIRNPLQYNFLPTMDLARKTHFIVMYLVLFVTIIRLYYYCINREYWGFFLRFKDLKKLSEVAKYYLFFTNHLPGSGRYNPGQKAMYNAWIIMIVFQVITGFMLYTPERFLRYITMVGGIAVVREVHFIITWGFIITVLIHVYFSLISGLDVLKSIFTGHREEKSARGI